MLYDISQYYTKIRVSPDDWREIFMKQFRK